MKIRHNVTIRWHESHYNGCPYLCGLAAQIHVPQCPGRTIQVDGNDPEGPSLSKLRAVEKAMVKAAVRNIVRPVVRPRPPPEKPQADQPSSTSSACAARNEKRVETQWVDTEQVSVTKANLFRLFADVTSGAPDWANLLAHLALIPNRASESHDYKMLKLLRGTQARNVHQQSNIKVRYFDGATAEPLGHRDPPKGVERGRREVGAWPPALRGWQLFGHRGKHGRWLKTDHRWLGATGLAAILGARRTGGRP